MTGGADEEKLEKQMEEIDKIQKKISGIKILKGAEVNIMKDGSLDINNETLAKLDIVGIAVHSLFNMSEKDMTDRICKAMENPHADILFHPTGRIINKREPYKIDMDMVLKKAKETGIVMEIDAYPERLDLKDEHIRKAIDLGVKLSVDTDAHSIKHLDYMEYGIGQARRGWAEKKDIINVHDWEKMLKMLK
jgi:DNA polymerase (family 10)